VLGVLLYVGVAVVVGAACVVAGAAAWVTAVVWVFFFLWWTAFFLWCCLALWCVVVVVLVVSAARCCLDLWLPLDEPPHPPTAMAAATIVTSARFIAPLRSLEDVDSGAGMLAQMLGRSPRSGRRSTCPCQRQSAGRRLAFKTGNMHGIWAGLLESGSAQPRSTLVTWTS
jgi:hypothetical protein